MHYFLAFVFLLWGAPQASQRVDQNSAVAIVARIQRADYQGDRAALQHLYDDLAPFAGDKTIESRIHYWRGFALWRRALNGFNESADRTDLERDLTLALAELEKAANGPDRADALSAEASCLQNLAFIHFVQKHVGPAREFLEKSLPLLKAAETAEPENPRVLWVLGASRWYAPPERGGGQGAAIRTYENGLRFAQQHKSSGDDPLKPSWGEPELLMNLAYSYLHQTPPELNAAEESAEQALKLVPYWHYLKDILLPQIQEAKAKATVKNPNAVR